MVCQNCGRTMEDWYEFCPNCGGRAVEAQPAKEFTLLSAYASFWKNFAVFRGRARRQEYWYTYLMQCIIGLVASFTVFVPFVVSTILEGEPSNTALIVMLLVAVTMALYGLVSIIPNIAIMVRRLHDTGRSGWYYFLGLIPYVGNIVMIVLLAQDSQPGENQYGPNPKGK